MHQKSPKICTCCRVIKAKIYLYHISLLRPKSPYHKTIKLQQITSLVNTNSNEKLLEILRDNVCLVPLYSLKKSLKAACTLTCSRQDRLKKKRSFSARVKMQTKLTFTFSEMQQKYLWGWNRYEKYQNLFKVGNRQRP